jgi:hypothetical protein
LADDEPGVAGDGVAGGTGIDDDGGGAVDGDDHVILHGGDGAVHPVVRIVPVAARFGNPDGREVCPLFEGFEGAGERAGIAE